MNSAFGWVDFAEDDRRRMLNVVHLFGERETRDELGIGTIRDAFADYFSPGTSTIQTRVKYMLFVPWMYLELERKKVPSSRIWRAVLGYCEEGNLQAVMDEYVHMLWDSLASPEPRVGAAGSPAGQPGRLPACHGSAPPGGSGTLPAKPLCRRRNRG